MWHCRNCGRTFDNHALAYKPEFIPATANAADLLAVHAYKPAKFVKVCPYCRSDDVYD